MIDKKTEALKLALERLEWFVDSYPHDITTSKEEFLRPFKEALVGQPSRRNFDGRNGNGYQPVGDSSITPNPPPKNPSAEQPQGVKFNEGMWQEPAVWTATRLWNRKDTWTCPADIEKDLLDGCAPPAQQQEPVAWTVAGQVRDWSKDFSAYQTKHYVRPLCTSTQAQQQPVATYHGSNDFGHEVVELERAIPIGAKLYTSPPAQRTFVGLTDEEIDKTHETQVWDARRSYARALEAKLRDKNK